MIFRYVWRELKAYPRYSALFILNVTIGLFGLAALESFKSNVQSDLEATSRQLAGGDLVVSSRIGISQSTMELIATQLQKDGLRFDYGETEELFTMAAKNGQSRLVQIRAQDSKLPYYGSVELSDPLQVQGKPVTDLEQGQTAWVYPEILAQFGLAVGDEIQIGGYPFKIVAVVSKDAAALFGRGALAPRVYISRNSLKQTQLIQKGSTVFYQKIFRIEDGADLAQLEKSLRDLIQEPSININSHVSVNESNARLMDYLNDYLGLVALIALLLSNIGAVYLFRAHLTDRLKEIAILKMLGLSTGISVRIYWLQVLVLGAIGAVLAMLASLLVFPFFAKISRELLPFTVELHFAWRAAGLVFLVGVIGTSLCVFPFFRRLRVHSAREVFQEVLNQDLRLRAKDWTSWLPFIGFFFLLSVWQANSWRVAGIFFALVLVATLLLFAFGALSLRGLALLMRREWFSRRYFEWRYALRELSGRPIETLTAFVALALGALLASLVFIVEASIQSEFDFGKQSDRPALFLFDIQDEQLQSLKDFTLDKNRPLQNISPLIRARLKTINDKPYGRNQSGAVNSREEQAAERSQGRGFNLSERGEISTSETVVEGRYFYGPYDPTKTEVVEASIEERFAERMGIQLGDRLQFEVLGVPIDTLVVGIRRVRWASFQPNFFVQLQPGVFTDTPKSYVASIGPIPEAERVSLQSEIVERFPNVSILDVSRTLARMLELASHMAWALKLLAALVLATAIAVVVSIQTFHVGRAAKERSLLEILGLKRESIKKMEWIEAVSLSLSAILVGWILSHLIAWPVTKLLFDRTPTLSLSSLIVFIAVFASFLPTQTKRLG